MTRCPRACRRGATPLALALGVVVVVVAASLAGGRVGWAAPDEVGLSVDEVGDVAELTEPLFDPGLVWVPGDLRTTRFWVRNRSDEAAVLAIDITAIDSDGLLATGAVTIGGSAEGVPMRSVTTPGTHRLVADLPVVAGGTVTVELTVGLVASAPNSAQQRGFTFEVAATLTASDVPAEPPEGRPTSTIAPAASTTTTMPAASTSTTWVRGAQPPGPTTTAPPAPPTTSWRPAPRVPATGVDRVPILLAAGAFLVTLGALAGRAARREHARA